MKNNDNDSDNEKNEKIDKSGLASIIAAHAAVDMQTMSLNTLLPTLLTTFSLNYATAAAVITMNQIVIAVFQPVAGIIGDRRSIRWLTLFGCALCGVMMASVTFLPTYWMIIIAVALSGIGSALFHPEALKHARTLSGKYTTTGTSWFFLGGNIGFGLAPLLVGFLIERFGIHAAAWMLVPTVIGCGLLVLQMRKFHRATVAATNSVHSALSTAARQQTILFVSFVLFLIILRSISYEGMKTFMPLYFAHETGRSTGEFAPLLTAISLSGIIGTIFSGPLADRIGRRNLMVISMLLALAAIYLFWHSEGAWQIIWIGVFGIAMTGPWTISVTMIQDAMPTQLGLAGGLTLGTAYGASGLGVGFLGVLANNIGLWPTLQFIALVPAVVLVLSLFVRERVEIKGAIPSVVPLGAGK